MSEFWRRRGLAGSGMAREDQVIPDCKDGRSQCSGDPRLSAAISRFALGVQGGLWADAKVQRVAMGGAC